MKKKKTLNCSHIIDHQAKLKKQNKNESQSHIHVKRSFDVNDASQPIECGQLHQYDLS